MGQIVINGQIFGETNNELSVTTYYTEGVRVADIVINGVPIPIYVPTDLIQNGGENS